MQAGSADDVATEAGSTNGVALQLPERQSGKRGWTREDEAEQAAAIRAIQALGSRNKLQDLPPRMETRRLKAWPSDASTLPSEADAMAVAVPLPEELPWPPEAENGPGAAAGENAYDSTEYFENEGEHGLSMAAAAAAVLDDKTSEVKEVADSDKNEEDKVAEADGAGSSERQEQAVQQPMDLQKGDWNQGLGMTSATGGQAQTMAASIPSLTDVVSHSGPQPEDVIITQAKYGLEVNPVHHVIGKGKTQWKLAGGAAIPFNHEGISWKRSSGSNVEGSLASSASDSYEKNEELASSSHSADGVENTEIVPDFEDVNAAALETLRKVGLHHANPAGFEAIRRRIAAKQ